MVSEGIIIRRVDVDRMLKRAADFQKLANPDDALSAMIREFSDEMELDESALDQVAAAAQYGPCQEPRPDSRKPK